MFSPRRLMAVAKKEYLELKRNKLFFMMTILAPLVLYFLFALSFSLEAKNIPIGFADLDKSVLSRQLIDKFATSTGVFRVERVSGSYVSLEKHMDLDRLRAIILIPEDFSDNIKKGMPAKLQVMIDGVNPTYADLVGSYINAVLFEYQNKVLEEFFIKRLGLRGAAYIPINLSVSAWYNSAFRSEDYVVPGVVALIIMFFPPIIAAISLAREKETGSILNMYCSSITRSEYLLGKMTPYIIISYVNCVLFILFSIFVFDVPMRGSPLYLAFGSLFFVSSVIAIGLLIAVLVNTQIATIIICSILTQAPSYMYSGFMVPLSNLGGGSLVYTYTSPATYYIDLIRKIMVKGAAFKNISSNITILAVFAVVLYFVCIKLFKKRLG